MIRISPLVASNLQTFIAGTRNTKHATRSMFYPLRQLLKNPGFAAIAVLTLALGIGANTAIFTVVNAVLLRPLPFPGADRLVTFLSFHESEGSSQEWESVFDPDFKEWSEQNHSFESTAAYGSLQATLLSGGEAKRIASAEVTVQFFSTLGATPLAGRTFLPEEHQAPGSQVVILSEGLWRDRFGGNPSLVGQAIQVDGRSATVVGILPRQFDFPTDCQIWTPLVLQNQRNNMTHRALGLLKPGVTLQQAQSEIDTISQRLPQSPSKPNERGGTKLVSMQEHIVGGARSLLFIFLGAVGFVLLIACTNAAHLLLARAASRQKEIQIRLALGASRGRIVRHFLAESVLLAVCGGIAGLLLAVWGIDLLVAVMPAQLVPRMKEIGLDYRVLGFNLALSLLTGIGFGLVPAWRASRADLNEALKEAGRSQSSSAADRLLRQGLVAAEIAFSIVLLIGAGLMVKSFVRLREVKLGFVPERTLTFNLSLPSARYPNEPQLKSFYQEALNRIRALPGVRSAGIANAIPLGGGVRLYGDFTVQGQPDLSHLWASKVGVSSDYFRALGVPLLKGRYFNEADRDQAPGVAIVSENLARRLWPDSDPLGQHVRLGIGKSEGWLEVVGVVGDVRQDDLGAAPPSGVYVPYQQISQMFMLDTMTFLVRTTDEPRVLAETFRKTIQSLDSSLPVYDIHTMEDLVAYKVATPRFNTWLLGSFSAIAWILALVGIYGVVSYAVAQRTREIGIRMALGARGRNVLAMVARQGMAAVMTGVVCGVVFAFALTRFLSSYLYSITPTDPWTFLSVAFSFIAIALAACLIPARRASRIDPIEALRYE